MDTDIKIPLYFCLDREDPRRALGAPDVAETRLGVVINHGRTLAALDPNWDEWEFPVPEPHRDGARRRMDVFAEAVAAILLAAQHAGLDEAEVIAAARSHAEDIYADGVRDALSRNMFAGS